MSAATASRNYGGTATQTMTAPHHQLYPTPHSSTGTVASSRQGVAANTAQAPRGTYGYPSSASLKTAGDSWSIQKEGDRQVIVIEDTPPPAAGSSSTTVTSNRPSTANASTSSAVPKGSKKARTNGYNPADAYQVNNLHYPPPTAAVSSSTAYGASAYTVAPAKASASSGKRKYNEVNDPSAAVRLCFPPESHR